MQEQDIEKLKKSNERTRQLNQVLVRWLLIKQQDTNLATFFLDHNSTNLAIYGAGKLSELLLSELDKTEKINIKCFFDKNAEKLVTKCDLPVFTPQKIPEIADIDMIVVAIANDSADIVNEIQRIRTDLPVVSIDTILDEMENDIWYEQYIK